MIKPLLFALLITIAVLAVSVNTMIYGWGIQPESWGWIIGGYIAIIILGAMSSLTED